MAEIGLLANISSKAINEFKKDLFGFLRAAKEIDKSFSKSHSDVDIYLKKFESLIQSFNKKYKNLQLKLIKKTDRIELKMLINEKSAKDAFANSASKILGLQSIGTSNYTDAPMSSTAQFTDEIAKIKDKIYIYYLIQNSGPSKLFLCYDGKAKKTELVYDDEIETEQSAEFQVAAFYALNDGYNNKMKIDHQASMLGFSLWPGHLTKEKYFTKFDPHFSE